MCPTSHAGARELPVAVYKSSSAAAASSSALSFSFTRVSKLRVASTDSERITIEHVTASAAPPMTHVPSYAGAKEAARPQQQQQLGGPAGDDGDDDAMFEFLREAGGGASSSAASAAGVGASSSSSAAPAGSGGTAAPAAADGVAAAAAGAPAAASKRRGRGVAPDAPEDESVLTCLRTQLAALSGLGERVQVLQRYVAGVQAGALPHDRALERAIAGVVSSLPLSDSPALSAALARQAADSALLGLLSSLAKGSSAVAELSANLDFAAPAPAPGERGVPGGIGGGPGLMMGMGMGMGGGGSRAPRERRAGAAVAGARDPAGAATASVKRPTRRQASRTGASLSATRASSSRSAAASSASGVGPAQVGAAPPAPMRDVQAMPVDDGDEDDGASTGRESAGASVGLGSDDDLLPGRGLIGPGPPGVEQVEGTGNRGAATGTAAGAAGAAASRGPSQSTASGLG